MPGSGDTTESCGEFCTGSSSDACTTMSEASTSDNGSFISHKVSKLDTLAGLAIKYNVSVADIKRANGLLSDSALYARDTVLIPTKLIPVGDELRVIFAQVAAGIGRDPVLNEESTLHPASAAAARVARTLNIVSGESYPPELLGDSPWWCQCGTCDEDQSPYCCSRRLTDSSTEPGDVELVERNADNTVLTPPSTSGPTRIHERVRRRHAQSEVYDDSDGSGPEGLMQQQRQRYQHMHSRASREGLSSSGGGGAQEPSGFSMAWKGLADLGKAFGESAFVQKIKQAATQPALAGPGVSSLSDAADGVLTSFRGGSGLTQRGGSLAARGGGSYIPLPTSRGAGDSGAGGSYPGAAAKAGGKSD